MSVAAGGALATVCSACAAPLPPSGEHCPSCGSPVFPPQRRVVTVLFADLAGYTAVCASLDAEEVHLLVRPLMNGLRRLCEELGAVVPVIEGDGFMAVFGALRSDEDDPGRALGAAVRLQHLVRERRSASGSLLPPLRVGVNAGEVLVAPSWEHGGFSVSGDVVNVASRLCELAGPGGVLVGSDVLPLVSGVVAWGEERQLSVRNRSEEVRARSLDWASVAPAPAARRGPSDAPLVGRAGELERLLAAGAPGGPYAVAVTGEPGAGKSRLVAEAAARLGRTVLSARCPTSPAFDGGDAVAELVRPLLGPTEGSLTPLARRRLRRLVGEATDSDEVDTEDEQVAAAVELLVASAGRSPLTVVVEDLHAAGPATRQAVDLMANRAGPTLALFVTSRTDEGLPPEVPTVELGALSPEESNALVRQLLPGASDDLVAFLEARGGGLPLYLEQCAQLLVDEGTVEVVGTTCRLRDPAGLRRVPTVMRLFVAARLDLLDPAERTLLATAAVLGDVVDSRVLEHLDPGAGDTTERLVGRGYLRWTVDEGVPQLRFRHALVRDVAYDSALRRDRAGLHERAADWYAQRPGTGSLGATARHFEAALALSPGKDCGLVARTVGALVALGSGLTSERPAAAVSALRRAESVALDHPSCPLDRVRLDLALARALEFVGDEDGALAVATSAAVGARQGVLAAEAMLLQARALRAQPQRSAAALAGAEALYAAKGDRLGLAQVQVERAIATEATGGLTAQVAAYERAYLAAQAAAEPALMSLSAQQLAVHAFVLGRVATRRWTEAARSVQRSEDAAGRARLLFAACIADLHALDLTAAMRGAGRARELGSELGEQHVVLNAAMVELEAAVLLGDDRAEELFEGGLALAATRSTPRMRCTVVLLGGLLRSRQGRAEEADVLVAQGGDLAVGLGTTYLREHQAVLAQLRCEAGRWADAERAALAAARLDQDLGQTFLALRPRLVSLGATVSAHGPEAGRGRAGELAEAAEALGAEPLAQLARLWAGLPLVGPLPDLAEARALERQAAGDWASAATEWARLGQTSWLTEARRRAGPGQARS